MGQCRRLTTALCLALSACGSSHEPASTPEPVRGAFSIHEWGLFAVAAGSPNMALAATDATGTLHTGQTDVGIGMGGFGTIGGKPVIYVHLDPGKNRVQLDVELGIPLSKVLERFPVGGSRDPRTNATSAGWHGVVAERGVCPRPTTPPKSDEMGCTTRDHFCEAAEIGRYAGDHASCLSVGESQSELLFYRAEALPTAPLPLRLVHEGDAWKVTGSLPEGPVYLIETAAFGQPVYIRRLEAADIGGALTTPTSVTLTPTDVGAALRAESIRRGLSAGEADAFVDAWAPAYFATCTRTGPEASGTPPPALAQVGRSLLYFAPSATIDQMVPLRTTPVARETKRVFLVRWVDETSVLHLDAMTALSELMGSQVGLSGSGAFGGTSALGSGCTTSCPRVVLGTPRTSPGLPSDVVRRVLQRNISQVRTCYERGVARNPDLAGSLTVKFAVTPTGSVAVSQILASTLHDAPVESCIAGAVRRLTFPTPDPSLVVQVTYPFELTTRGR